MSGLPRSFILRGLHTVEPIHLYVDTVSGDDASPDGSQVDPLQTLAEAERRIPLSVHHYVVVHLKAQDYTCPHFRRRTLSAGIYLLADKAWDPTVETVIVTGGTGVAAGGTGASAVVDAGLTLNALDGFTIEMTSGPAAGQRRTIRDNTTTTIVPVISFSPAPVAGNTYKVTRWNTCRLIFPGVGFSQEAFFAGSAGPEAGKVASSDIEFAGYCFIGVGLRAPGEIRAFFRDGDYVFLGCEKSYSGASTGWDLAFMNAGAGFGARGGFSSVLFTTQAPLSLASGILWLGWGLFQDASESNKSVVFVAGRSQLVLAGKITNLFVGGEAKDSYTQFVGKARVPGTGGSPALLLTAPANLHVGRFGGPQTLVQQQQGNDVIQAGSNVGAGDFGRASLYIENADLGVGSFGSTVLIKLLGNVDAVLISTVTGTPPVVVPGFGNKAVQASHGARVQLVGAPAIGGGVLESDFDVGNGAPQNKTFFAAVGDGIVHSDGTVIERVS